MRRVFKSLICIVTSLVILTFSVVSIPASAEITPEQEVLNNCLVRYSNYFEQGIPYQISYFQNLNGWTNNKSKFDDFISKSIYPNRMYVTRILYDGNQKFLYVINYDEIIDTNYPRFSNAVVAQFCSSISGEFENMSLTVSKLSGTNNFVSNLLATNYSGFTKAYISFSVNGQTIILDDGVILSQTKDSNAFKFGLSSLLGIGADFGGRWKGEVSLLGGLIDLKSEYENGLSASLTKSLGVDVAVGDDTYKGVVSDLVNNTTTSNVWNNLDSSTTNSIRNTYSNLKNVFDNSVTAYTDGDNYYYTSSTADGDTNYFNYDGDTTTYYQTYIYNNGSNGDGGNSGSSVGSGSGAYAEANAEGGAGGNANIGDININVGGDTTSTSTDSSSANIDISSFEKLINQCEKYWQMVTNLINMLPAEISLSFAGLITVVVICRVLGR